MPELPEVENTCRYLIDAGLPGLTFTGAEIGWAKTVRSPGLEAFISGVEGGTVQSVDRRGKYILAPLARDGPSWHAGSLTLVLHLGMTGGLRVQHPSLPAHPMVRHTFSLDDGRELRFIDGRKFGKLWLAPSPEEVLPPLSPDPLGDEFTAELLAQSFKGRNAPVKALMLEQSIVAGMGNLYADESLYLSGIHPLRPASELSEAEVSRLRESIVAALTSALQQYDQSRTESWPDPPMGLSTWTIPRDKGGNCRRCGGPISAIRVRARGTCFCPVCQV